eukprot:CAMPEP_0172569196 /NCGR_PEP_ID=MMETSP1067-20121228/122597_1 /TAXON_ID=265564 ORGANISM="Thalassiosira punctigera, Strain Tpunct2005C2" /NCGR_SAMPLE_ID=MMETSP1067 /ASSEMBLY_ACC=CAM_ASM_000444 /LENGTH=55 /DNA_ID=CAMNT_0013360975 /DNA_START=60 /DNA_END=227 /DNA_ORIENTATION=-
MTRVVSPQYAGSGCVCNCSISGKKEWTPPFAIADANTAPPSGEENDMQVDGNCLR